MIKIAQKKELEANSKLQEARAKEASVHLYEIEVDEKKVMLNDLEYRISELQDVLDEYKHQIRGQKELVWYYKKKEAISQNDKASASADDDLANVARLIEGSFHSHLRGKHNATKAKVVVDNIFHGNLLNGVVATLMKDKMREYIRQYFAHGGW
jgi:succinylglutamate desuccinylase